jgi:CheY-like chemotaxis protein
MAGNTSRVLVVDDEPDMVVFLCAWLEDNGYEALSATDGERALQLLLEQPPHVVLMDLNMPNHSGFELYREIQSRDELRRIPVIFITGLSQYKIFNSTCAPLPEPAACIQKPIDVESLRDAIARILKRTE